MDSRDLCHETNMMLHGEELEVLLDEYCLGELRETIMESLIHKMHDEALSQGSTSFTDWAAGLLRDIIFSNQAIAQEWFALLWDGGHSGLILKFDVSFAELEDVRQEVALRAWEKFTRFDPLRGQFNTWLGMVIRTVVKNRRRHEMTHMPSGVCVYASELDPRAATYQMAFA